jgi:hypothetical protein
MNEKENESSFAFGEVRVYRLNRFYRVYHFVVGAAALVGAVLAHHFFILSMLLVPLVRAAIINTWLGKAHPISEASAKRRFKGDVLRDCALDAEGTHVNAKVVAEK